MLLLAARAVLNPCVAPAPSVFLMAEWAGGLTVAEVSALQHTRNIRQRAAFRFAILGIRANVARTSGA